MVNRITGLFAIIAVSAAAVGCSQRNDNSDNSTFSLVSPTGPSLASSAGGTMKETLTGPAIGGVMPEGQALADESQFTSGGSTILTVQVKRVNVANGTVLPVALDYTPVGSITISNGEGTLRADLGHFAVSRDQVTVKNAGVVILSGSRFN